MNVLIRCDGSSKIGLGHIIRSLALADELQDVHNFRITFAIRKGMLGITMVEKKRYRVITPQETDKKFDYGNWLNECVRKIDARAIVFDVRDGLTRSVVKELREKGILIVTIDDPEDKRLEADMAFYPPVPQVKRINWAGFAGELYVGWEWVILRKEFSFMLRSKLYVPCAQRPKVLVTMGGSDPQAMTIMVVKALEFLDEDFETVVILGSGFQHKKRLNDLLSECKHHFEVQKDVKNISEIMSQSDLAVASFGMTAYELAAMGVPSIYLCLTQDHAESASVFVEEGMAIWVGVSNYVSIETLADKVRYLLKNISKKFQMTTIQKIDGRGVERIANLIIEKLASG